MTATPSLAAAHHGWAEDSVMSMISKGSIRGVFSASELVHLTMALYRRTKARIRAASPDMFKSRRVDTYSQLGKLSSSSHWEDLVRRRVIQTESSSMHIWEKVEPRSGSKSNLASGNSAFSRRLSSSNTRFFSARSCFVMR